MGLNEAWINWKNFARMMVGKPKRFPVKVMRTAEAKRYPLMKISKDGDVGYNLASVTDVTIPAPNQEQIGRYHSHSFRAERYRQTGNIALAEYHEKQAMEALPKAVIPTGVHLEMPNTLWCSMEARSSSSSKMLITPDAIIDAGYRGELFAVVYNFGYSDYKVTKGEMLVQVIFHERVLADPIEVDKLGDSDRGVTGFGSSGSKAEEVSQ